VATVPDFPVSGGTEDFAGETTGRYLVLFAEQAHEAGLRVVQEATGQPVTTASTVEDFGTVEGSMFFDHLGVAVMSAPPETLREAIASAQAASSILAVEPERVVYALEATQYLPSPAPAGDDVPVASMAGLAPPASRSADYLMGFRDAVLYLTDPGSAPSNDGAAAAAAVDESQVTWGLQAVSAALSCRTGRKIRLAVLDTGFDLTHPDFAGRPVVSASFIAGQPVQDGHGHGTHCIGTAAGPKCPPTRPRYGVANEAEIFAGKVLSNAGSGTDSQILAGINWAVAKGCAVISMSLGAPTTVGQPFSTVFETVAQRAAAAGALVLAAAGNDSRRPGVIHPVSHPANCPSILAVAAVDAATGIAPFSNRGLNPNGGQVDVAGPGVDIYSSWPMPTRYRRLNGTSMATPHAAGVAALLAEANPTIRGAALAHLLTSTARRLGNLPSADVGAGLVQAP
jgi:subtilisin